MGQRRRGEGKTTSSPICTETQTNQRNDQGWSEGGGRQKLKHADGNFPICMRRESDDKEKRMSKNEDPKGRAGGSSDFVMLMVTCH